MFFVCGVTYFVRAFLISFLVLSQLVSFLSLSSQHLFVWWNYWVLVVFLDMFYNFVLCERSLGTNVFFSRLRSYSDVWDSMVLFKFVFTVVCNSQFLFPSCPYASFIYILRYVVLQSQYMCDKPNFYHMFVPFVSCQINTITLLIFFPVVSVHSRMPCQYIVTTLPGNV